MRGSKSDYRHLCSELVFITRADRRAPKGILGNLEEIGEKFAEILADCSFPRATAVRILTKDHELEGFVEDCRRDEHLGFFIKIRLAPESRWSEKSGSLHSICYGFGRELGRATSLRCLP